MTVPTAVYDNPNPPVVSNLAPGWMVDPLNTVRHWGGDARLTAALERRGVRVVQIDEANLPGSPDEWKWAADALNLGFVRGVPPYIYVRRLEVLAGPERQLVVPAEPGEPPDLIDAVQVLDPPVGEDSGVGPHRSQLIPEPFDVPRVEDPRLHRRGVGIV